MRALAAVLTPTFLAVLLAAPPASAVTCAVKSVGLRGAIVNPEATVFDTTAGDYGASYDLALGTLGMRQFGALSETWVDAADFFDVIGVPAGTPVSLVAQLTVDGSVYTPGCGGTGCAGRLSTRLSSGAVVDEKTYALQMFTGSQPVHDVRQIAVTIVAGTPVEIRYRIGGNRTAGGFHGSEGTGQLTFLGSTPGVTVVSCQGYSTAVTSSRHTSWGEIKTIYR